MRIRKAIICICAAMAFSGGMARAVAPEPTQERVDSVSTAAATVFGAYVGETIYRMQAAGLPIDIDSFTSALGKVLKKEPTGFTPDQADRYMSSVMEELRASVADTVSLASQQEYLRQQASRKGVVTTPSGLLFEVPYYRTLSAIRDSLRPGKLHDTGSCTAQNAWSCPHYGCYRTRRSRRLCGTRLKISQTPQQS